MPIQLWLIIGFMTGSGGKIQTCVWVKTDGETSMPGFIQECCSWWMFARHSQAKLLVVWTHKHGTMCSYKEGRIEKRTEAGSEGLLHDCVSVCSGHCFSLCFVFRYSNHWLSHFSPVPFICPDRSAFVCDRAIQFVFRVAWLAFIPPFLNSHQWVWDLTSDGTPAVRRWPLVSNPRASSAPGRKLHLTQR